MLMKLVSYREVLVLTADWRLIYLSPLSATLRIWEDVGWQPVHELALMLCFHPECRMPFQTQKHLAISCTVLVSREFGCLILGSKWRIIMKSMRVEMRRMSGFNPKVGSLISVRYHICMIRWRLFRFKNFSLWLNAGDYLQLVSWHQDTSDVDIRFDVYAQVNVGPGLLSFQISQTRKSASGGPNWWRSLL